MRAPKKPKKKTASGETRDRIQALGLKYHFNLCVECGKCSSTCTMVELFPDYAYDISPRGTVERVRAGEDILGGRIVGYCLACDVCTAACPNGVLFRDFMDELRDLAISLGIATSLTACSRCGKHFLPTHTVDYLRTVLKEPTPDYLLTCPTCRRYVLSEKVKPRLPGRKGK
jgi:heterodisulfide reductase subunit C